MMVTKGGGCGGSAKKARMTASTTAEEEQNQLSPVTALLAALRKSMASCRVDQGGEDGIGAIHHQHMEIGWPTNVRHIAHVTFDRFHGFLGLPVEFEVEIPCQAPSARYCPVLNPELLRTQKHTSLNLQMEVIKLAITRSNFS